MSKLLKIEAMKLKKSMAFKVMMIIIVAMNLFAAGVYKVLELIIENISIEELGDISQIQILLNEFTGYQIFNGVMGIADDVIMLVLIFLCISIGDDFSNRTLQNEISAGYSRNSIVISRLITGSVVFVIYSLLYTFTMVFFVTIMFGFGRGVTPEVIGDMILRYILSIIGNIGFLSIFVLIIFAVKKTGISIGICLASSMIGLPVLIVLFTSIGGVLKKIYQWLPFGTMGVLMDELDSGDMPLNIARIVIVAAVTIAVTTFINIKTFKKAELK